MYCEQCGKQISDQSEYCIYCGKKVEKLGPDPGPGPNTTPSTFHGWYYNLNGTKGPFTRDEMTKFLGIEVIRPRTMVRPPDSSEWCAFEETNLYKEILDKIRRGEQEKRIKCIAIAICASFIGILMFLKWLDIYFFKVSIIEALKIMGEDWTLSMGFLTVAAVTNLILCIYTVIRAIRDNEPFIGAGFGSVATFITTFIVAHDEEIRMAIPPYLVLVLGIIIIILYTVNIGLQQVYQRFK